MREDLKTCVEIVIDDIKSMSGNELETYLFELCKMVGTESEIEVDAENILEISGVSEKLEFLDAVYENIENEEDKNTFLRELLSNEHNLDYKIIEHFKNKVQVPEELENDTNDSGSDEELEDEQELDGPTPNPNYSSDDSNTDETIDDNEEDLEDEQEKNNDEQLIDGPAITEYKAKTNEMEKELEELMANLNDSGNPTNNEPDYNNAIETLKNTANLWRFSLSISYVPFSQYDMVFCLFPSYFLFQQQTLH